MEMQSKSRVELRLKVKILYKMSNWAKDSGWSHKKNGLITLGHHAHCRTKTERQIAKYCPTRSLDRCTESVLIGRLLEVKGDSVKAFNFYMSMKTAEGKQDCACKTNEYGRTAEETFTCLVLAKTMAVVTLELSKVYFPLMPWRPSTLRMQCDR